MAAFTAGDIVIAEWRGDALPKEPNKLRPAVVIEDDALFGPDYPNVILVQLTEDVGLAIQGLMEPIEPSPENGRTKRCYALAPFAALTSAQRLRATRSRITPDRLARIRRQVAEAIGLG
nr:type II toxin-antitoxin system PemK/MazF family toxin [uncultured Rhodopila sp.]